MKRTIVGAADFSGRSRRTEILVYWIAFILIVYTVDFLGSAILTPPTGYFLNVGLNLLLTLPMFALFTRRMHDQDRTGWWALLLPLFIALSIYQALRIFPISENELSSPLPDVPFWLVIAGLATWGVVFVLTVIPGTDGANRYGPDPRA